VFNIFYVEKTKQVGFKGEVIHNIRTDTKILVEWKKETVICPYCLFKDTLNKFHTKYEKKRKGRNISLTKVKCPCCGNVMNIKTPRKIAELSMKDYAYWFWSRIFTKFNIHDRVDWDNQKARLKMHTREQQEIFWEVYWLYKNANNKTWVTRDYEDEKFYREQYERESLKLIIQKQKLHY